MYKPHVIFCTKKIDKATHEFLLHILESIIKYSYSDVFIQNTHNFEIKHFIRHTQLKEFPFSTNNFIIYNKQNTAVMLIATVKCLSNGIILRDL